MIRVLMIGGNFLGLAPPPTLCVGTALYEEASFITLMPCNEVGWKISIILGFINGFTFYLCVLFLHYLKFGQ